jgi:hypothetical protein
MAIGLLGVRSVLSLLSAMAALALVILFLGRAILGKPVEAESTEPLVIH